MFHESRDDRFIVVTFDGLFLGMDGELEQEYPNACVFARFSLAQRAARDAGSIGPYNVLSTDEYQMEYQS